jgi:D-lactate dehydrogenase (cytochrome)
VTSIVDELRRIAGDRVSTADSVRDLHGRDESALPPRRPDAVVFARSADEVAQLVRACHAHSVPVIAWGAGTSLEGQLLPTRGGVTIDLSQMDRIVSVNAADLDVQVEAGVRKDQLNAALRDYGLFFAVDPGADATIGGMAATGASGTMTVRYGTIRDVILGLDVVLADGTLVHTGSRARKSSAGYDLTHLFVGSEGTLGLITSLTVRVFGIPEQITAASCSFPTMTDAVTCASVIVQTGVPIARCEFVDAAGVRAVNAFSGLAEPETATLFFEFHGTPGSVAEQVETVRLLSEEHHGSALRFATKTEDRSRLWAARHDAYFAMLSSRPGCRVISTDACVPVSQLAVCVDETQRDASHQPFPVIMLGHVADGNFHCGLMINPDQPTDQASADAFTSRLAERAIRLGGSVTGEHGVGLNKRHYLTAQLGPEAVALMRTIKRALDPAGILNPDKVLEPDDGRQTRWISN